VSPISQLAGQLALARRRFVEARPESRRRLRRPVISIGNLSVGGSGKTPVVQALAGWLRDEGFRPSILSRGYGREDSVDGVVVVSDGTRLCADVARAGDEPMMLARRLAGVAVVVSPDRYLAGVLAEHTLGCDVHVLDDGFQHLRLARDLDLVIVGPEDAAHPSVLPAGRLREPLEALRHADALLWSGAGEPREMASRLGAGEAFALLRTPGPIESEPFCPAGPPPGARVIVLAAIARPERFVQEVRDSGFDVAETVLFRDHHRFTGRDLSRIADRVRTTGAGGVLTTEKDMVRLLRWRPLPFALAWRGVTAAVEPAGEFAAFLRQRLAAARNHRAETAA
jgi:tetraacyldisaccharide 4'-kinase